MGPGKEVPCGGAWQHGGLLSRLPEASPHLSPRSPTHTGLTRGPGWVQRESPQTLPPALVPSAGTGAAGFESSPNPGEEGELGPLTLTRGSILLKAAGPRPRPQASRQRLPLCTRSTGFSRHFHGCGPPPSPNTGAAAPGHVLRLVPIHMEAAHGGDMGTGALCLPAQESFLPTNSRAQGQHVPAGATGGNGAAGPETLLEVFLFSEGQVGARGSWCHQRCLRGSHSGHCGDSHSRPCITPTRGSGPWKTEDSPGPTLLFPGAQQGGRWVCVFLDLFPSHLYLRLVTHTGQHCQSHLGEVTALPLPANR